MKDILDITQSEFSKLNKEEQEQLVEKAIKAYEKGELSEDEFQHIFTLDYNEKYPAVDRTYP